MPNQPVTPYILVVDDEPDIRELIKDILEDEGYEVATAENAQSALKARKKRRPDLVLLDIWMPDIDGISILREWASEDQALFPVIMMSGHGSVETAVEATRLGAYDYIEKPLSTANLLLTIKNALKTSRLSQENLQLKSQRHEPLLPIGSSRVMQEVRRQIERVAMHNAWVLINGEAGVGKELFAHYLHQQSPRSDGAFIQIRSASLMRENACAELFGSEENGRMHYGLLEQANGGTFLIEEISELDLDTQAKLCSALKTKTFHRAGGIEPVSFDTYVIATTHRDLAPLVREGRFREDLYYLLNVVPITVPPLREHAEDIPELFEYYVEHFCAQENLPFRHLDEQAALLLKSHDWPGNIRELKNLVQRLLILGQGPNITSHEIQSMLGIASDPMSVQSENEPANPIFNLPLRAARENFERQYFSYHLARNHGNISELANISGMERTHLYRKLKSVGIDIKQAKRKAQE